MQAVQDESTAQAEQGMGTEEASGLTLWASVPCSSQMRGDAAATGFLCSILADVGRGRRERQGGDEAREARPRGLPTGRLISDGVRLMEKNKTMLAKTRARLKGEAEGRMGGGRWGSRQERGVVSVLLLVLCPF